MDKLVELRGRFDTLKAEITTLSEADALTAEQETRFDAALDEFKAVKVDLDKAEARAKEVADVLVASHRPATATTTSTRSTASGLPKAAEARDMRRGEVREAALRVAEARGKHLSAAQQSDLERKLQTRNPSFDGEKIGRMLIVSESDEYHSAFMKHLSGNNIYTVEEGNAAMEMRAANEGTGSAGGFGIPILIDPTIILTSGAKSAPILDICTVTTITTDQWKGVNSAGFTWSYYAEAAVVTDNTVTMAQPTIPVYRASGFLPYTLEVGDDYPGFQEEMAKLLAQGYLNQVAVATATGSGSSQPTGVFTALQNQTNDAVPRHRDHLGHARRGGRPQGLPDPAGAVPFPGELVHERLGGEHHPRLRQQPGAGGLHHQPRRGRHRHPHGQADLPLGLRAVAHQHHRSRDASWWSGTSPTTASSSAPAWWSNWCRTSSTPATGFPSESGDGLRGLATALTPTQTTRSDW